MVLSKLEQGQCYFFTALPCEAKPLINHYQLKKELDSTVFAVYRNKYITLTVTGLGKSAMAAGVAYSLALFPCTTVPILLNVGIAGHCSHQLGSVFVVDKMTDQDTGRSFYPQLVSKPPCLTHSLITVSQPQLEYPSKSLYDMEASAFYEIAARFSSSELIHCIKVISDNKTNPITDIRPAQVSQLIFSALPLMDSYSQQLGALAKLTQSAVITHYTEVISQWRFSSSEKLQLKSLLSKRGILIKDRPLDLSSLSATPALGKFVLQYLSKEIDALEFGGFLPP